MLKTPAALLGMLGGDEMYVLEPGMTSTTLSKSVAYKAPFTTAVDMVILMASTYSTVRFTITYPNKEQITAVFSGGGSGEKATSLCWPIPKGSTLAVDYDRVSLTYVPLVPAKSVGG